MKKSLSVLFLAGSLISGNIFAASNVLDNTQLKNVNAVAWVNQTMAEAFATKFACDPVKKTKKDYAKVSFMTCHSKPSSLNLNGVRSVTFNDKPAAELLANAQHRRVKATKKGNFKVTLAERN